MWWAVGEIPINIPKRRRKTKMGICYSELRWASATQNGNGRVLLEEKRQMESGSDNLKRFETTDVKG